MEQHSVSGTGEAPLAPGQITHELKYYYDHANRWIRKTLDKPYGSSIDSSTAFVYDGNQIVLHFEDDDAAELVAGDLNHRYLWGPAVDQLMADEAVSDLESAGSRHWPLGSKRGHH